jgi:hypothetical protein
MNEFISLIGADNFESEVLAKTIPVLVLCMPRKTAFQGQLGILDEIYKHYGNRLKMCLIEDEFIDTFKKEFNVIGTPTFIIFLDGVEEARMLGQLEKKTLEDFLLRILFT